MVKFSGQRFREWWRQTPRIEVPELLNLGVKVEFEDESLCFAHCINISLTGLLLEIPSKHIHLAKVDRKILLSLTLGNEDTVIIPGIIRRHEERRVGIHLPDTFTGPAEQNDPFHQLIKTIERVVLRQKTQGGIG